MIIDGTNNKIIYGANYNSPFKQGLITVMGDPLVVLRDGLEVYYLPAGTYTITLKVGDVLSSGAEGVTNVSIDSSLDISFTSSTNSNGFTLQTVNELSTDFVAVVIVDLLEDSDEPETETGDITVTVGSYSLVEGTASATYGYSTALPSETYHYGSFSDPNNKLVVNGLSCVTLASTPGTSEFFMQFGSSTEIQLTDGVFTDIVISIDGKEYTFTNAYKATTGSYVSNVFKCTEAVAPFTSDLVGQTVAINIVSITSYQANGGTITLTEPVNGTVSISKSGFVKEDVLVEMNITADTNYELSNVIVVDADGNTITLTGHTFIMPNSNVTVTAEFNAQGGGIINSQSTGGTFTTNVSEDFVIKGTTVTVTCTPSSGYYLSSLTYTTSSGSVDITSSKSFVMPNEDVTIQAVWAKNKYTITINQVSGGTITTSVTGSIEWGTSVTVTATPNTGYSLSTLTYNGTSISNGGSFTMPQANVTVTGSFTLSATHIVTVGNVYLNTDWYGYYSLFDTGTINSFIFMDYVMTALISGNTSGDMGRSTFCQFTTTTDYSVVQIPNVTQIRVTRLDTNKAVTLSWNSSLSVYDAGEHNTNLMLFTSADVGKSIPLHILAYS